MSDRTLFYRTAQHGLVDPFNGSQFGYLNRDDSAASQRLRALLEEWYSHHPDPENGLRSRFREDSADQHVGAWWELYVFTVFRRLGYSVTPSLASPDLLVIKGESRFQVECRALFGSKNQRSDAEQWLLHCVNDVHHPDYYVSITISSLGGRRVAKRQVTPAVSAWLSSLDYGTVRESGSQQSRGFTFGATTIRLTPLAVAPDRRGQAKGLVGVGPATSAFPVNSVHDIRKALKKKARQCRDATEPLAIAVLNRALFARHREMGEALFGTTSISFTPDAPSSAFPIRNQDGLLASWTPTPRRPHLGRHLRRKHRAVPDRPDTSNLVAQPLGTPAIHRAAAFHDLHIRQQRTRVKMR